MPQRFYIAIDLKSFFASVECVDRGFDPLAVNLVVADESRTEKTICLAVSPSLKAFGIPGRARLFEVVQRVREVNAWRLRNAPGRRFTGRSVIAAQLDAEPSLELGYVVAPPRMARYMEVSQKIFSIYMRHVSPDDIHVYSIDEVFIDATQYLRLYRLSAHDFAMRLIRDVLNETGITATAGIGDNLYLAKVAMDIVAKRIPADRDGVRIAQLDELSYRRTLWTHRPLTDFWRVGRGYASRLESHGILTMGDIARLSLAHEDLLYRLFGVNAELLIDHAWGWEPCTIAQIKEYRPESSSRSVGQVLPEPYPCDRARLAVKEMADSLSLELAERHLMADQMVLTVGYDVGNIRDGDAWHGAIEVDRYGRQLPQDSHGSLNLGRYTAFSRTMVEAVERLFDRIANPQLLVRRMYVVASHVVTEEEAAQAARPRQLELFTDDDGAMEGARSQGQAAEARERKAQDALIAIRRKLGRNAILKGMNLEDGATARTRNRQIGGHQA